MKTFTVTWTVEFDEDEDCKSPEDAVRLAAEVFDAQSIDPDACPPIFECDGEAFEWVQGAELRPWITL